MSSSIEEAVNSARYNEACVVTVSNEENNEKREIVLIATLDKTTGGVSWQDASSSSPAPTNCDDFDSLTLDVGIQRHLRTKIWIRPMLNDEHRNTLYASSIRKACSTFIQNRKDADATELNINPSASNQNINDNENQNGINILDIGAGTGLLAMLVAKAVQDQGMNPNVTSIEMASAMARLARKVVQSNRLDDRIDVIEGHSCHEDFLPYGREGDGKDKASICTSELLETGLLGEGILPAMRDAWERHLADDAVVVPQRARVYATVIEGRSYIRDYCGPHCDNDDSQKTSVRLSTKNEVPVGQTSLLLGGRGGGGVRVPIHADSLFDIDSEYSYASPADIDGDDGSTPTHRTERAKALSESTLVLKFNFSSKDEIPHSSGRTFEKEISALRSGIAHGVLFHWELDLWDGETYSTAVGESPWQDHWQQCLYVFADENVNAKKLTQGQTFTLVTHHDDTSISFQIVADESSTQDLPSPKRQRVEENKNTDDAFEENISYDRALQLNDKKRMRVLHTAIENAIHSKGKHATILDISDFSLCAIIAARAYGATNVTSLESSTNGVPYLSAVVAQIGNQLPCEGSKFQVINAYAESLTTDHLGGKADIVMAEPYYEILESWHLQEALNYFYLLRCLKRKGLVNDDAISLPASAYVVACAVQLDDSVAAAHSGLRSSSICGFVHDEVIGQEGSLPSCYDMKLPAFQYKWKRLSKDIRIASFQYDGPASRMVLSGDGEWSQSGELEEGVCHGIFVWVEYDYDFGPASNDGGDEKKLIVSTGNRHHQQSFRFLKKPANVKNGDGISVKPSFNTGTLEDHDFEIKVSSI